MRNKAYRWLDFRGALQKCQIHLVDFRKFQNKEPYDRIVSIGMVEHVPLNDLFEYYVKAFQLLTPGGLFLCQGISSSSTSPF
ncbi:MAG: class I SAM-dependent methyltransferase [Nitrospirales bacterium]|nr:class I SAM-dependent methyltransferase [Nitrospirales bacterium]